MDSYFGVSEYKNSNLLCADSGFTPASTYSRSIQCPHCGNLGSFDVINRDGWKCIGYSKALSGANGNSLVGNFSASIRCCPNIECRGIVFSIEDSKKIIQTFPYKQIDFDRSQIPNNLFATLNEAISCHSVGAYRASAIMVRRLLEEICADNNAQGKNLHERLEKLKSKIVLPAELFDAMDTLKLLGNDAAHVEAKNYDSMGKDESSDAIEIAKEILKALYQLKSLVARLQARKAPFQR